MARPKNQATKERLNLTIDKIILKNIKDFVNLKRASLSQFTEDYYKEQLDMNEKVKQNPKALIENFKKQLDYVNKIINKKEEENKS